MIGFIGFGRMGSALAKGALASKVLKPLQMMMFDQDASARKTAKSLGLRIAKNGFEVAQKSDIVFLCVKPQGMREAVGSLKGVNSTACFVSIEREGPCGFNTASKP